MSERWRINLPVFEPETLDNSMVGTYSDCPRLGLYRYGMRRGFGGKNWPIQFGLAYHKYRETIENESARVGELTDETHGLAIAHAMEGFEEPPAEHRHSFLTSTRLGVSCEHAYRRIQRERKAGQILVTQSEDSFDLTLPFWICHECGMGGWGSQWKKLCPQCGAENIHQASHGGRVDQHIAWGGDQYVRDFKTTSRMGPRYWDKYSPNGQLSGYVWSGHQLSGRRFGGALVEVLYNTKTEGPIIKQRLITRTAGAIEQWQASMFWEHRFIRMMFAAREEMGYLAFPQRTNHCGQYSGCAFRDACQEDSGKDIDKWLENYTIYSHWDFTDPDKEAAKK
jgi:hypothetical protein